MRVIVSPVGISVLLNALTEEEVKLNFHKKLNSYSNEDTLPEDIDKKVEEITERAKNILKNGDTLTRRRLSAEINGLYGIYQDKLVPNHDIHILISTDTALGKKSADIIRWFLELVISFSNVQIITPEKLNTASVSSFSQGMKELLKIFDESLPGYLEQNYKIIFNLTGGFKSIQGYLNIIGMFYADKLVYIFEGGKELLKIPKLPIKIDEDFIKKHAIQLASLEASGIYPVSSLKLSEAFLEVDEKGYATLSAWGLLIWQKLKRQVLSHEQPLPFSYIVYEKTFLQDFKKAEPQQRIKIQETLARVNVLLEESNGDISVLKRDGGLQYDNYSGQSTKPTPIGHFRISRSERITCTYKNGKLYLRHYGSHDYTEQAEGLK